ncbi:alpha-E domain-containing protein [Roseitranquillus sediminis]|uniref:alpha-E domain-containing protein n=1 Tax=Roseitranquillus sediminis TaxID=2809051 RepID=UPI001D0CD2A9|nr:alpha-E domain-containing protein [Roseitranquillus sediminis]MBM9594840.1 alpha-E domain-containing protein [Roseitranquillus sediminis]
MLSRTAENLYWMTRYLERAETIARLLSVGERTSLTPNIGGGYRNEWHSVLLSAGTAPDYTAKYGQVRERDVVTHLFFDEDNPSSVASCITRARENGRIVRTALTTQMWDALNAAFGELRELRRTERSKLPLGDLVEWTMRTTAMMRGTMSLTHLRNDGYDFLNLGYYVERTDATARLLDVKYYVLLPQVDLVGSGLDNYQWRTLLRSMSAHRAFAWAYGGEVTPAKIADFLILNRQSPRSLLASVEGSAQHLERLARGYGRTTGAQGKAREMAAELVEARIEDIQDEGLHEFLSRFILENGQLAQLIHEGYLNGDIR